MKARDNLRLVTPKVQGPAPRQVYSLIAPYYDRIFAVEKPQWRIVRHRLLREALRETKSMCDLGSGTGTTALDFARTGIKVYGVDRCEAMCRVARRKARQARLPIHILRGDMRSFRLPEQVDIITCESNAINHIPRRSDLKRVASAAARALKPGGWFFFDVLHRAAFEDPSDMLGEARGLQFWRRAGFDPATRKGWLEFTFFIARTKRLWEANREIIWQNTWSSREIRDALRGAGFARVRAYDLVDVIPSFKRSFGYRRGYWCFYVARKPNSSKP